MRAENRVLYGLPEFITTFSVRSLLQEVQGDIRYCNPG